MSRRTPGHIERHGRGLRVHLCVAGARYKYTLDTTNRKEAAQWAKTKHAELERQAQRWRVGYPGPLPLPALVAEFEREEGGTSLPADIVATGDGRGIVQRVDFE